MKGNGDYEISDVPRLLEQSERNPSDWRSLLAARAALMDGAEALLQTAATEERALKREEQRTFDGYAEQVREINARLAEHKRQAVANVVAAGFPAEYCRLPF